MFKFGILRMAFILRVRGLNLGHRKLSSVFCRFTLWDAPCIQSQHVFQTWSCQMALPNDWQPGLNSGTLTDAVILDSVFRKKFCVEQFSTVSNTNTLWGGGRVMSLTPLYFKVCSWFSKIMSSNMRRITELPWRVLYAIQVCYGCER